MLFRIWRPNALALTAAPRTALSDHPSPSRGADGCSALLGRARLRYSIQAANSASAASSDRLRATARTLDGTQSGKGTSLVT